MIPAASEPHSDLKLYFCHKNDCTLAFLFTKLVALILLLPNLSAAGWRLAPVEIKATCFCSYLGACKLNQRPEKVTATLRLAEISLSGNAGSLVK